MKKLPLIEPIKRPCSIHKSQKLCVNESENDKDKFNSLRNYDIAISYYTKGINNDKSNTTFLINRAICYLAKGFYTLSLKDALKSIEIDPKFLKGYYIASLSYLEMYDIEKAEKFTKEKNQRLLSLIENKKKDIKIKSKKFKSYPIYIKFLKELYKYDAYFPKLEIHFYSDEYRGVCAKSKIVKEEIIMTIPKECLISLELAMETNVGKEIGKFMYSELNSPKHCLLSAFLLTEEKSEKWKFYFDLLPKDFSNFPIFYTEKELEYLKGSPFLNQVLDKKIDMKIDYEKICFYIPSFSQFSYQKFCEARMMISSRIFGIQMGENKTDVLAPFADLLNHKRPRQTQWYYDNMLESFVIQAIEDINEGSEIFDSYGKKTNSRFLLNYGFSLENNDSSEYPLTVSFNNSYPLFEVKKNLFQSDFELVKTFNLNNNIYESQLLELLSFLRFMLFDGDINILFNAMTSNDNLIYEDISLTFYYISPISKELEIKVLKHLHLLCRKALNNYPTTYEEDNLTLKSKKNISFNYRNCLLLLMSEKSVLSYYIYFCEYCLSLFNKTSELEILTKLSMDYKYNECQFDFYIQEVIMKLIKIK
jgi:histone-lysine N-methyltransferase SETD3